MILVWLLISQKQFFAYFLMWEMSGEETYTEAMWVDSTISKAQKMQAIVMDYIW